jgi:hypothetical protein
VTVVTAVAVSSAAAPAKEIDDAESPATAADVVAAASSPVASDVVTQKSKTGVDIEAQETASSVLVKLPKLAWFQMKP